MTQWRVSASVFPNVLTRYEGIECVNHSPMIYAYGEKNIGLTGDGTLDAAATSSWNKGSDRAYLEALVAKGTAHSNTDGCDPESCDHVVIANCALGPTTTTSRSSPGAITCGSEQTGGIRNVYAYKLTVKGETKFALYVKSNTLRGGFSENINLDSVSGTFARSFAYVTSTYNSQTGGYVPSFGTFAIGNCSSTKIAGKTLNACELITPGGNWSSYPPHKHDEATGCEVVNEEICARSWTSTCWAASR